MYFVLSSTHSTGPQVLCFSESPVCCYHLSTGRESIFSPVWYISLSCHFISTAFLGGNIVLFILQQLFESLAYNLLPWHGSILVLLLLVLFYSLAHFWIIIIVVTYNTEVTEVWTSVISKSTTVKFGMSCMYQHKLYLLFWSLILLLDSLGFFYVILHALQCFKLFTLSKMWTSQVSKPWLQPCFQFSP